MTKLDANKKFNNADSNGKPAKCSNLLYRFSEKKRENVGLKEKGNFCMQTFNQIHIMGVTNTCLGGMNCIHEWLGLQLATTISTYTQSQDFWEESKGRTSGRMY